MTTTHTDKEIAKFDALAADFWNRDGKFKTLHQINPIRLAFIEEFMTLAQQRVADIGCGGGILAEALSDKGAEVTAIDLSETGIATAKTHQQHMEMLEHVEHPEQIIADCAKMVKTNGLVVFSTINRTRKAHLLAVLMAEYVLGMVPQGTHDAKLFIKPSEMQNMASAAGLVALDIIGFVYRPLQRDFVRSQNTDINYIFAFQKRSDNR